MATATLRRMGYEYSFNGRDFTAAVLAEEYIPAEDSEDGYRGHMGYHALRATHPTIVRGEDLSESVRDELVDAFIAAAHAEAAELARRAEAAKKAAEEAAHHAAERRGHGQYECVMCHHRQDHEGLCDYCGDAYTA